MKEQIDYNAITVMQLAALRSDPVDRLAWFARLSLDTSRSAEERRCGRLWVAAILTLRAEAAALTDPQVSGLARAQVMTCLRGGARPPVEIDRLSDLTERSPTTMNELRVRSLVRWESGWLITDGGARLLKEIVRQRAVKEAG